MDLSETSSATGDLTSTMESVLTTNEQGRESGKNESVSVGDSVPSSSSDANLQTTTRKTVLDDPISSTSDAINSEAESNLTGRNSDLVIGAGGEDGGNSSELVTDTDFFSSELNISSLNTEKISEDVEDIANDLENLLGESSNDYNVSSNTEKSFAEEAGESRNFDYNQMKDVTTTGATENLQPEGFAVEEQDCEGQMRERSETHKLLVVESPRAAVIEMQVPLDKHKVGIDMPLLDSFDENIQRKDTEDVNRLENRYDIFQEGPVDIPQATNIDKPQETKSCTNDNLQLPSRDVQKGTSNFYVETELQKFEVRGEISELKGTTQPVDCETKATEREKEMKLVKDQQFGQSVDGTKKEEHMENKATKQLDGESGTNTCNFMPTLKVVKIGKSESEKLQAEIEKLQTDGQKLQPESKVPQIKTEKIQPEKSGQVEKEKAEQVYNLTSHAKQKEQIQDKGSQQIKQLEQLDEGEQIEVMEREEVQVEEGNSTQWSAEQNKLELEIKECKDLEVPSQEAEVIAASQHKESVVHLADENCKTVKEHMPEMKAISAVQDSGSIPEIINDNDDVKQTGEPCAEEQITKKQECVSNLIDISHETASDVIARKQESESKENAILGKLTSVKQEEYDKQDDFILDKEDLEEGNLPLLEAQEVKEMEKCKSVLQAVEGTSLGKEELGYIFLKGKPVGKEGECKEEDEICKLQEETKHIKMCADTSSVESNLKVAMAHEDSDGKGEEDCSKTEEASEIERMQNVAEYAKSLDASSPKASHPRAVKSSTKAQNEKEDLSYEMIDSKANNEAPLHADVLLDNLGKLHDDTGTSQVASEPDKIHALEITSQTALETFKINELQNAADMSCNDTGEDEKETLLKNLYCGEAEASVKRILSQETEEEMDVTETCSVEMTAGETVASEKHETVTGEKQSTSRVGEVEENLVSFELEEQISDSSKIDKENQSKTRVTYVRTPDDSIGCSEEGENFTKKNKSTVEKEDLLEKEENPVDKENITGKGKYENLVEQEENLRDETDKIKDENLTHEKERHAKNFLQTKGGEEAENVQQLQEENYKVEDESLTDEKERHAKNLLLSKGEEEAENVQQLQEENHKIEDENLTDEKEKNAKNLLQTKEEDAENVQQLLSNQRDSVMESIEAKVETLIQNSTETEGVVENIDETLLQEKCVEDEIASANLEFLMGTKPEPEEEFPESEKLLTLVGSSHEASDDTVKQVTELLEPDLVDCSQSLVSAREIDEIADNAVQEFTDPNGYGLTSSVEEPTGVEPLLVLEECTKRTDELVLPTRDSLEVSQDLTREQELPKCTPKSSNDEDREFFDSKQEQPILSSQSILDVEESEDADHYSIPKEDPHHFVEKVQQRPSELIREHLPKEGFESLEEQSNLLQEPNSIAEEFAETTEMAVPKIEARDETVDKNLSEDIDTSQISIEDIISEAVNMECEDVPIDLPVIPAEGESEATFDNIASSCADAILEIQKNRLQEEKEEVLQTYSAVAEENRDVKLRQEAEEDLEDANLFEVEKHTINEKPETSQQSTDSACTPAAEEQHTLKDLEDANLFEDEKYTVNEKPEKLQQSTDFACTPAAEEQHTLKDPEDANLFEDEKQTVNEEPEKLQQSTDFAYSPVAEEQHTLNVRISETASKDEEDKTAELGKENDKENIDVSEGIENLEMVKEIDRFDFSKGSENIDSSKGAENLDVSKVTENLGVLKETENFGVSEETENIGVFKENENNEVSKETEHFDVVKEKDNLSGVSKETADKISLEMMVQQSLEESVEAICALSKEEKSSQRRKSKEPQDMEFSKVDNLEKLQKSVFEEIDNPESDFQLHKERTDVEDASQKTVEDEATSSNEILIASKEVLRPSTEEVLESASTSSEVLKLSSEVFGFSSEVLMPSTKVLSPAGETLRNSREVLESSSEILESSSDVSSPAWEALGSSGKSLSPASEVLMSEQLSQKDGVVDEVGDAQKLTTEQLLRKEIEDLDCEQPATSVLDGASQFEEYMDVNVEEPLELQELSDRLEVEQACKFISIDEDDEQMEKNEAEEGVVEAFAADNEIKSKIEDENSGLKIGDASSELKIEDERSGLNIEDQSCELTVEDQTSELKIEDQNSELKIEETSSEVKGEDQTNELKIENQSSELKIEDGSSGFRINEIQSEEPTTSDAGGDLEVAIRHAEDDSNSIKEGVKGLSVDKKEEKPEKIDVEGGEKKLREAMDASVKETKVLFQESTCKSREQMENMISREIGDEFLKENENKSSKDVDAKSSGEAENSGKEAKNSLKTKGDLKIKGCIKTMDALKTTDSSEDSLRTKGSSKMAGVSKTKVALKTKDSPITKGSPKTRSASKIKDALKSEDDLKTKQSPVEPLKAKISPKTKGSPKAKGSPKTKGSPTAKGPPKTKAVSKTKTASRTKGSPKTRASLRRAKALVQEPDAKSPEPEAAEEIEHRASEKGAVEIEDHNSEDYKEESPDSFIRGSFTIEYPEEEEMDSYSKPDPNNIVEVSDLEKVSEDELGGRTVAEPLIEMPEEESEYRAHSDPQTKFNAELVMEMPEEESEDRARSEAQTKLNAETLMEIPEEESKDRVCSEIQSTLNAETLIKMLEEESNNRVHLEAQTKLNAELLVEMPVEESKDQVRSEVQTALNAEMQESEDQARTAVHSTLLVEVEDIKDPPEYISKISVSENLKMTITKHKVDYLAEESPPAILTRQKAEDLTESENAHSILKIFDPQDSFGEAEEERESLPRLIIKPVVKPPTAAEEPEHLPKITIKPIVERPSVLEAQLSPKAFLRSATSYRPGSPKVAKSQSPLKLTIKPVPKPDEVQQQKPGQKLTIKPILKPEEISGSSAPPAAHSPKITIKTIVKSEEDARECAARSPKLTMESAVHSPKITIKPIVKPEEVSECAAHSPKITIKPIVKPEEVPESAAHSPKIIIKPIVKPEEVSECAAHSPKITIKPIVKPEEVSEFCAHSPKITIKPVVKPQDDAGESPAHSPKITIKPIVKPEEAPESAAYSPKITIKPVVKPQEEEVVHSPKITIRPVMKPVSHDLKPTGDEEIVHCPKITIKPIMRPSEQDPKPLEEKEQEVVHAPKITIKPVVKSPEQDLKPQEEVAHGPKITIKPIVKPSEPDLMLQEEEVVHGPKITIKSMVKHPRQDLKTQEEEGAAHGPKITIKPIVKPPEQDVNPRLTIKPVVRPVDVVKQESVANVSPDAETGAETSHSPRKTMKKLVKPVDEDLPAKETPEASHSPRITIKPIVKPAEEQGQEAEAPHNPRITIKPVIKPEESENALSPETSHSPRITIKPIVKPPEEQESSVGSPKITIKPIVKPQDFELESVELIDFEEQIKQERIVLKINKTPAKRQYRKRRAPSETETEKLAKIKVKYSRDRGRAHIVSPLKRALEDAEDWDLKRVKFDAGDFTITPINPGVIKTEETEGAPAPSEAHPGRGATFEDPLENIPVFEITPETAVIMKNAPVPPMTVTLPLPPAPRKRGRPRKIPLVVREEFKDVVKEVVKQEGEESLTLSEESGRPKRSCRGPSVRTTLGIRTRRPRGSGRGRGRGRGSRGGGTRGGRQQRISAAKLKLLQEEAAAAIAEETKRLDAEQRGDVEMKEESSETVAAVPTVAGSNADLAVLMEEETRMSADINSSRAQTPAKQVLTPGPGDIEDTQSSVHSTATTESGKGRKAAKMEVHQEPEGEVVSADQLAEYFWGGGGPYMLQEQVAQFLGIKSFKRKYPGIHRRPVEMQERDFIRESGLASEAMCDLGLTSVNSADILDIMYSDFQHKYEEYCKHQRDRQAKDFTNKQKALSLAASQEKNKQDITQQAVQSAASWNAGFNKARREERKACMDLQTFTVHYPKGKMKKIDKPKVGHYPVALVPGQFTDYYKTFTPTELNNLPLNTMLYEPINVHQEEDSHSDGTGSDSDSSSSCSDSSSSDSSGEEDCNVCSPASSGNKKVISTAH